MSQLFEIEIVVRAVVVAKDVTDAYRVALNARREIVREDPLTDIDVGRTITEPSHLPGEWVVGCLPFGATDDKTIADYLAEQEAAPVKDESTADMFEPVGAERKAP